MYKYHRIRGLREDNEISQEQCAKLLYVAKKTYERYENGLREPPIGFMERVADLYGVSIDYLCGRTDTKSPYPQKKRS